MLNLFKGNNDELLQKELLKNKIDIPKIQKLIDSGVDINSTDSKGRTILFSLVAKKKIDSIKILIENGIDINKEDKFGKTAINEAIDKSDGLMIRFLIDNGVSINYINSSGRTLLQDVALEENSKVFQILMKYNPDLGIKDNYGKTVLFDAVLGGNLQIIKEVINNIDDLNIRDHENKTALFEAVLQDDPQITHALLSHGMDVNAIDDKKQNALFPAIVKGSDNTKILDILLTRGARPNQVDSNGKSLIDHLLELKDLQKDTNAHLEGVYKLVNSNRNYLLVARQLVENGLAIDKVGSDGKTLLSREVERQNYENIKFLIQAGAGINVKDHLGKTALFYAFKKGLDNLPMIDFLIENGADFETRNFDDKSLLDELIHMSLIEKGLIPLDNEAYKGMNREGNFQELLRKLFKYKPNLDIRRKDGRTTLFDVIIHNDFDLIRMMFNYGVDPNILDNEGNTPLSIMVENGLKIQTGKQRDLFLERLVFVLKFRVNVDIQDIEGRTVYHKAVIADDLTVVEKLLTKKADLSIKDKQGRTALHHTQWKGNYKIARWLIAAGANMDEPDNAGFTLLNYAAIFGHTKLVIALVSSGVLMYNRNKKSKKVAQFFQDRISNLQKLFTVNISDNKMKRALEEVCENLKKEIEEALK